MQRVLKSCPTTRRGGACGERRYSSYSFSTSALDGVEWSASLPDRALALGKGPPVSIVPEAGWAPEPVWTQRLEEKSCCLCRESNLDRPVVQPVARHYTDWATQLICNEYTAQNISYHLQKYTLFSLISCQVLNLQKLQMHHPTNAHRILNLGTRGRWEVSITLQLFLHQGRN
jgi:hypothetical protein